MSGSVRPRGTTWHPGYSSRWRSGSVPRGSGPPRGRMFCREDDDDAHPGFVDRAAVKRPRMRMACGIRPVQRSRSVSRHSGHHRGSSALPLRAARPQELRCTQPVTLAAEGRGSSGGLGIDDRAQHTTGKVGDHSDRRQPPPVRLTGRRRGCDRKDERTMPMRRRPRSWPAGRSAGPECRASLPCRRGWRRCLSRGRRRHQSAGPLASGRCA